MSARHRATAKQKEERRNRRRRRKVAAATSTMLLVAAAVAGEPMTFGGPVRAAASVGGGLPGMTDPNSVSANGEVGEDDAIGEEVLAAAGDIDRLAGLGPVEDLPTGLQGIPGTMMNAYQNAAEMLAESQPGCNLHWSLLASIGRIESNHARGGRVDDAGNTVPNILGPVLNGGGFAAIRDTDNGALDGDTRWDRAVGAMQFIPSTWRGYASDGNADGVSNPHNVWDATVAAGRYLCSGGMDLSDPKDVAVAVFRYNHSETYVRTVMIWAAAYKNGTPILPDTAVNTDPTSQALAPRPVVQQPGAKPPAKPKPSTGSQTRPPSQPGGSTGGTGSSTRPPDGGPSDPSGSTSIPPNTTTPCVPPERPPSSSTTPTTTTDPTTTETPSEPSTTTSTTTTTPSSTDPTTTTPAC